MLYDSGRSAAIGNSIATDHPESYNKFNVHYVDKNLGRTVRANACVSRFAVDGILCHGEVLLNSASFRTPVGSVSSKTYPTFSTWDDNFADFPFVYVKLPGRDKCDGGFACSSPSSLRGLFVFHE